MNVYASSWKAYRGLQKVYGSLRKAMKVHGGLGKAYGSLQKVYRALQRLTEGLWSLGRLPRLEGLAQFGTFPRFAFPLRVTEQS